MEDLDLSQFKEAFIAEAKEHLAALNGAMLELEKNPDNRSVLNDIFRAAHTLKGMSATMGYEKISSLTHSMEDVLDKMRKEGLPVTPDVTDTIFECFDSLEKLVGEVETGSAANLNVPTLVERLKTCLSADSEPDDIVETNAEADNKKPEDTAAARASQRAQKPKVTPREPKKNKSGVSIRVNTSYLDGIMNLVGEMVIAKAQLEQIADSHKIEKLKTAIEQFDRIAIDLQEAVLKTRMVPVAQVFDRYPRMIRDLTKKLGKEIRFEMIGAEIEIDRLLLDEINEPLVHILRNAIDHGIELPSERSAKNKSNVGSVTLEARRERGHIGIIVTDDGKGLDPAILKRKAVEKSILTDDAAKNLSDEDALMLICDPRFSTAEKITDISGRGVGMDVVKTMVESFNGRIRLSSKKNEGTRVALELPLSMAIISVLLAEIGGEIYAIPLNNITEIVACEKSKIKTIENREVVILRDEVLPLVRLADKFGARGECQSDGIRKCRYLLRIENGGKTAAFSVDALRGRKEIVLKTLGGILRHAKGFSGATITGDGAVILIIDAAHWM